MTTFTVSYNSELNEGGGASSPDDLKGAHPPPLTGLAEPSMPANADVDIKGAGPPTIPGIALAVEAGGVDTDLQDSGPPPLCALAPTVVADRSGPPPIEELK
jgi:hypothetical protein